MAILDDLDRLGVRGAGLGEGRADDAHIADRQLVERGDGRAVGAVDVLLELRCDRHGGGAWHADARR